MGYVILVWLLQAAAIAYSVFSRVDGHALARRALAAIKSGPVILLVFGIIGFFYAINASSASGDTTGAIAALISFALQLILLIVIFLRLLFSSAGGNDMVFGSARFATAEHAQEKGLIGTTGFRLGTLREPFPANRRDAARKAALPLHYTGERHLITVAPTRAGKGVSVIIPNLKTWQGSCIVIDPKGENFIASSEARLKFSKCHLLHPWLGEDGVATFNPVDILTPSSPTLIEDAQLIADALIIQEDGYTGFWSDEARALITGYLLHIATSPEEDGRRHLGRLRDMLCATPDELADIGMAMARSSFPAVAAASARFISKSDNERSGVLSTAQQNTHFLDSPALRKSLASSSFRFADLKGPKPVTLYVVLPVDRLTTYSRWLRLLIAIGIAELARTDVKSARPVWFVLDEFAQLGRMKIIEDAYGLMAGLGIQLHAIVQDISQLERLYDKGWQTFIANAGMIQVFGTRDLNTADYFSKMMGMTTRTVRSSSHGTSEGNSTGQGGSFSWSKGSSTTFSAAPTQRPLLFPDELMRMDRNAQILFIEGADPVLADKIAPVKG